MSEGEKKTVILLVTCPDRKGLVATVANFIYAHNANILHTDEHTDPDNNLFLMRIEWDLAEFGMDLSAFVQHFTPIAEQFQMRWRIALSSHRPRIAIFVSRLDHCLADLLYRYKIGELQCDIRLILSNHVEGRELADFHHVPFCYTPVATDTKKKAEAQQLKLLAEHDIELVVLARYMQILSDDFIGRYPHQIINIHHSFLPAFIGAKPYHRSYERGVKLVGTTSHYVTHRDTRDDLIRKGRDLERVVLSRGVRWHIENRILVYGNKTAIFV